MTDGANHTIILGRKWATHKLVPLPVTASKDHSFEPHGIECRFSIQEAGATEPTLSTSIKRWSIVEPQTASEDVTPNKRLKSNFEASDRRRKPTKTSCLLTLFLTIASVKSTKVKPFESTLTIGAQLALFSVNEIYWSIITWSTITCK